MNNYNKYKKYKNKYNLLKKNIFNMIGGDFSILTPVITDEANNIFDTFYANTLKKRKELEEQQFQSSNVLEFIGEKFFTLSSVSSYLDYPPL